MASGGGLVVMVRDWDQPAWARHFAKCLPGRKIAEWPDISSADAIAYAAVWRPDPGALAEYPNLKVIFNLGAGVDHLLDDPTLPDVPLVRLVDDSLTAPMSEYVVFQVLLHFRRHLAYSEFQRQKRWKPLRQPRAGEVGVGIMGLGTLGVDAAKKLAGLGFDVAGWSRSPKTIEGIASFAGDAQFVDFLQRTDILVSLLPATPKTKGLADRSLFARLRRDGPLGGAIYINAGRGATQNETDILTALDAGELAGASIDVFETEPLDANSALWHHPRVVITPHVAADTDRDAAALAIIAQIVNFEAGRPLAHVVDPAQGY